MRITNATLIKVQLDDRIPTPHFTLNIYFLVYRFIFISYPCTVKQEKKILQPHTGYMLFFHKCWKRYVLKMAVAVKPLLLNARGKSFYCI